MDLNSKQEILANFTKKETLSSILNFGRQVFSGWQKALDFNFPVDFSQVNSLVVCGMGGSRFPAIITRELFKEEIKVPFFINDDYSLPGFVDDHTLLVACSYSGSTQEVLTNVQKGFERKAKIFGVSSGGKLKELAQKLKFPCLIYDTSYNPSNQPRMGFGYTLGILFGLLTKLELLDYPQSTIERSLSSCEKFIKDFGVDVPEERNLAKTVAKEIFEKVPIFVVGEFLIGAGNALANQTNETSKSFSEFRVIPELNHHLMEGLKHPAEIHSCHKFLFIFSSLYSPLIQKRFQITKEVVEKNQVQTIWIETPGENKIEQTFYILVFGLYLTFYLSLLYQEDSTKVPFVDYFKEKLNQ